MVFAFWRVFIAENDAGLHLTNWREEAHYRRVTSSNHSLRHQASITFKPRKVIMKKVILCCTTMLAASSLFAAVTKDDVTAAAKKLGEQANYSWKSTVTVPEGSRFRPGPTEGKAEKDGYIYVKMSFGDNSFEIVKKGDKAAFTNRDGEWQTLAEAEGQEGPERFMAAMVSGLKTPAGQAAEIAGGVKEFKEDGEAVGGDLTEAAAKDLLRFRRGGGDGPTITDAKGSAKFWIKDGQLSKFEFKVSGNIDFNGNQMDMDRTTTVVIKDVGTTKIELPDAAKKKLEGTAPAAEAK